MANIKELTSNFTKLDKFVGVDFRRWQKKMIIFLTTLNVAYVISTSKPKEVENETVKQKRKEVEGKTMISFAGDTFSTGCKIRSLISKNIMSLLRNYGRPWRTNIWRRMLAQRNFL